MNFTPTEQTITRLLTRKLENRLVANFRQQQSMQGTEAERDFWPVVKLFTPDASCIWLLTEFDPVLDEKLAFGLCDLGVGFPELGYVSLAELATVRGRLGLPVERDRFFTADKPLSAYADEAVRLGHIRA